MTQCECGVLTADLFAGVREARVSQETIADGAVLLRGFAKAMEGDLVGDLSDIVAQAPFRQMFTPGGHRMSVVMTNCGDLGWVTDRSGYRYDGNDPQTGKSWPSMPASFRDLAGRASAAAG